MEYSLKSFDFGVAYLDNLIMHQPCPTIDETITVWRALESHVPHDITSLGISNVDLPTLKALYEVATVKPSIVQNRFTGDVLPPPEIPLPTPMTPYDADVRAFCSDHDIVYQPWGTLWGTPNLLKSATIQAVENELCVSKEAAL